MDCSSYSEDLQLQAYKILSSNDNKQMETLFAILFSSKEPQRSIAYNLLLCCKDHHPSLLLIKLIFLLRYSPNIDTRFNSAYVLSFVKVQNLWTKLPLQARVNVKSQFLECLQTEKFMPVLRILCGVVAELVGEFYKGQDEWKDLLDVLGSFLSLENDKFQETALLVFANIPVDCRRLISEALSPRMEILHRDLLRALASLNVDVKVAAFGAVTRLLYFLSGFLPGDWVNSLILGMLIGVYDLLKDKNEECAQKGLGELINLVTEEPQILKSDCLHSLVFYVLKIAESGSLRDETKNCAIQLLMAVVQAQDSELAMQFLPSESMAGLLCIPMRMLIGILDDSAWYEMGSVEGDNAGKTGTYHYGIKCLNQMSIVLGKNNIVPIVFKLLPVYMDAQDWQTRHAGITMLGVISKDCSAEMILLDDYLNQVVNILLTSFQDAHPRVCWAAFNLMHMPTDLVCAIQILHYPRLVPALIDALDRKQHPRVEEELASTLLFFVKSISQDCLNVYIDLDIVLRKLLALFKGSNTSARCRTIALHIFNFVVKEHLMCVKHCASYLPFLLEICTDENSELRKEATLGIRICAELGGSQFRPFIKRVLIKLGDVITYPNGSCPEGLKASDIAVGAIGKICEFHCDIINATKLLPTWLNLLPIKHDITEAKAVHEKLCSMVERSAREILGANCEHLYRTFVVFLEVISQGSKLASADTVKKMKDLIKQICLKFPNYLLDPIFFSLNDKQQQVLASDVFESPHLNPSLPK